MGEAWFLCYDSHYSSVPEVTGSLEESKLYKRCYQSHGNAVAKSWKCFALHNEIMRFLQQSGN